MYAQELTNTFAGQKKSNLIISRIINYVNTPRKSAGCGWVPRPPLVSVSIYNKFASYKLMVQSVDQTRHYIYHPDIPTF